MINTRRTPSLPRLTTRVVAGLLTGIAVALAGLTGTAAASPSAGSPLGIGLPGLSIASPSSYTAVMPSTTSLGTAGARTTWTLPGGDVMTSLIPAPGFSPLTASATQLQFYGFPARPTDPSDLAAWTAAMAAYRSDLPPTQPMQVVTSSTPAASPAYTNWGGYIVGNQRAQSNAYVAVKTEFSAPSVSGCSASALVGFWIGLGGTIQTRDNTLVQQGIECGDSAVGGGSALRPFSEFANTQNPVPFCGQTSWTIPAGDHLYQNMSFETSSNQANFYVEDETSGVAHSCSVKGPGGWSYDDNTAEWIGEAPSGTAPKFSSVQFTDAYAETGSGSWVSLGSQSPAETIAGADSSTYCIAPSGISSGDVFSDAFHQATCY